MEKDITKIIEIITKAKEKRDSLKDQFEKAKEMHGENSGIFLAIKVGVKNENNQFEELKKYIPILDEKKNELETELKEKRMKRKELKRKGKKVLETIESGKVKNNDTLNYVKYYVNEIYKEVIKLNKEISEKDNIVKNIKEALKTIGYDQNKEKEEFGEKNSLEVEEGYQEERKDSLEVKEELQEKRKDVIEVKNDYQKNDYEETEKNNARAKVKVDRQLYERYKEALEKVHEESVKKEEGINGKIRRKMKTFKNSIKKSFDTVINLFKRYNTEQENKGENLTNTIENKASINKLKIKEPGNMEEEAQKKLNEASQNIQNDKENNKYLCL